MLIVGKNMVFWLIEKMDWTREQSCFFGRMLLISEVIHNVDNRADKSFALDLLYRFQIDESGPLNWRAVHTDPVDQHPCTVVENLFIDMLVLVKTFAIDLNTLYPY